MPRHNPSLNQAILFQHLTAMSHPHLHIAILEADTPLTGTCALYGSYGGVFTSLFHKAADAISFPCENIHLTGYDVVNTTTGEEGGEEEMGGMYSWKRRRGYPNMEDVDAVLITGSRMWVPSLSRCGGCGKG